MVKEAPKVGREVPTAVELITAMVVHYEANSRLITANAEVHSWKQNGAGGMIVHAAMVAYGDDYESAVERVGDMLEDIRAWS